MTDHTQSTSWGAAEFFEGLEGADVASVHPTRRMGFLRAVLKSVAAVKIKLGRIRRRAARDLPISSDADFSQKRYLSPASQKGVQTKMRAPGSPCPKLRFDVERISTISIGRCRFSCHLLPPDEICYEIIA